MNLELTQIARDGVAEGASEPVYSMTGYARITVRPEDAPAITLTLKSMNHRFLDLQLRLPSGAEHLEGAIRSELKRELARGHVECTLTLERQGRREEDERRAAPQFDLDLLRDYVANFRAAAAEVGLFAAVPDLNEAARLPGMLLESARADDASERAVLDAALARVLPGLLSETVGALKAMRAREGASLAAILTESLDRLGASLAEVGALRGGAQDAYFARLSRRLQALLGEAVDRDRVLAEAAMLAERGDVEEELARMAVHIGHFRALLGSGGEAGKKLDFLLQEMNREANTLLSKTAGITGGGARITECGLAMKSEIEKLREQVQNLE